MGEDWIPSLLQAAKWQHRSVNWAIKRVMLERERGYKSDRPKTFALQGLRGFEKHLHTEAYVRLWCKANNLIHIPTQGEEANGKERQEGSR